MVKKVLIAIVLAALAAGYWLGVRDQGRTVDKLQEGIDKAGDQARDIGEKAREIKERGEKAMEAFE